MANASGSQKGTSRKAATIAPSPWDSLDEKYRARNLAAWDERAPAHARAPGYRVQNFVDDPAYISDVVRFDLPRLPDVSGLVGLHLQCHIGTDTVSLVRLGASMTGLDFSGASVDEARRLAEATGADARFVQADAYDAVTELGRERFDFVFTGIGALCWLPDVRRWAEVVNDLLKPGGFLFIREGHPMLWTLDENADDALVVRYPYFETAEPVTDDYEGSYLETDTTFAASVSHSWNHGIGETTMALLDMGMTLELLVEHDSAPWEALGGKLVEDEHGEWRLKQGRERLPMTYTLLARKPA